MINTIKSFYIQTRTVDRKYPFYIVGNILADVFKVWLNVAMIGVFIMLLETKNRKEVIHAIALFAVLNFGLNVLSNYFYMQIRIIGTKVDSRFNISVFQNMLKLEYEEQEKEETKQQYEFANMAINEIGIVKITGQITAIAGAIVNVVIAGAAVSFLNVWLILAVVIVAGLNVCSERYRIKCRYEVNQQKASLEWNMYYVRDYLSTFRFAKEIRIFGMRDYVLDKLKYFIERYTDVYVESEKKYFRKYGFVYVLDGFLLAVIYFFGMLEFMNKNIEIGALAIYFSSMTAMVAAILNAVKNVTELTENSQYILALQSFLKIGTDEQDILIETSEKLEDIGENKKGLAIEFDHVSFRYPGTQEDILKNISFRITDGEKIAIVGKNGAGKTTLIYLLLRLYRPTAGRILINGKDYLSLSEDTIYKVFSVVLQDFGLYPFSIFSNVSMCEDKNPDRIKDCIEKVGLSEKIAGFKHQGDTFLSQVLDEEGVELSGGEAQRLAMARALYKGSSILILDEPTAALSPKNEYDLYAKFKEISRDKTTIFISHKLAMCRLCDRIIVLDDGMLDRIGSHDELMQEDNLYSKMFRMQAESFHI